jgi:hypothetical protein
MYSRFEICGTLAPAAKCIRLRKRRGDAWSELFHEHFPRHRISEFASIEMMKALVLRYKEAEAPYILRCYLNRRGRVFNACDPFQVWVEYPEPGVIRTYCGTDIQAWLDTVIAPEEFRQTQKVVSAIAQSIEQPPHALRHRRTKRHHL